MKYLQNVRSSLLLALLAATVLFTGCEAVDDGDDGVVRVYLTDAPIEGAAEVNVTIERVELVSDDGEVVVLTDETMDVDLLELQHGVSTTLAEEEIPADEYKEMRIIVGRDARIVFDDGTDAELKIPSGEQTGIKVKGLPEFHVGDGNGEVAMLVDFDAFQSIHRAGNSGKYILRPVIKLEEMEIDDEDVDFDAEDEVHGEITAISDASFTVDGQEFFVDEYTDFEGVAGIAGLSVGTTVEVEYVVQDDGTLLAVEVEIDDGDDVL